MKIFNQSTKSAAKKSPKKLGRGISAGGGKTAGRGTKGQKSRAGHNIPRQFEGGQTNLSMRLPKIKGFRGIRRNWTIITLDILDSNFKENEIVSMEALLKKGIIKKGQNIKILANGTLSKKLYVEGVNISKTALKTINDFAAKSTTKSTTLKNSTEEKANI